MKGIILSSHGKLAEGMMDTINLFSDHPQQIETVCLLPGDEIATFKNRLETAIQNVDTGDGAIIFCDLLFGTPCNTSALIYKTIEDKDNITIITGMNLPMILEYLGSRELGMDDKALIEIGKNGIVNFSERLANRDK